MTATLIAIEFTSVDGVMQGLGSPDEDRDGGFEHGGWGAPYSPGIAEIGARGSAQTQAYLFGRRTFEKMAAFWPTQPDSDPIAASLNASPKFVASTSLRAADWAGTTILAGDATRSVATLKEEVEGTISLLGSGVLLRDLLRAGLVDELQLFVHPLMLGTGKRLFGDLPHPETLQLVDVGSTSLGSIAARYVVTPETERTHH